MLRFIGTVLLFIMLNNIKAFKMVPVAANAANSVSKRFMTRNPLAKAAAKSGLARTFSPMQDMFNLFDNFDLLPSVYTAPSSSMLLDIKETDSQYEVFVDIPGVDKKDINISARRDQLTISADRSGEKKEESDKFTRLERYFGHTSRTLTLPDNADPDSINAEYKDGVLKVTVLKTEKGKLEFSRNLLVVGQIMIENAKQEEGVARISATTSIT